MDLRKHSSTFDILVQSFPSYLCFFCLLLRFFLWFLWTFIGMWCQFFDNVSSFGIPLPNVLIFWSDRAQFLKCFQFDQSFDSNYWFDLTYLLNLIIYNVLIVFKLNQAFTVLLLWSHNCFWSSFSLFYSGWIIMFLKNVISFPSVLILIFREIPELILIKRFSIFNLSIETMISFVI